MAWNLEYDSAAPALPKPVKLESEDSTIQQPSPSSPSGSWLPGGCYLVRLEPIPADWITFGRKLRYEGTLRVEWQDDRLLGSGDLYISRPQPDEPEFRKDPKDGIPIFARDRCRYYLRLARAVQEANGELALTLEMHRFDPEAGTWTPEGALAGNVRPASRANGILCKDLEDYPPHPDSGERNVLFGTLANENGTPVADLSLGWLSTYLRRAALEIWHHKEIEPPRDNGNGLGWQQVYEQVGWDLQVSHHRNYKELEQDIWTEEQLHEFMRKKRKGAESNGKEGKALDSRWRYLLLCVKRIRRIILDPDEKDDLGAMFGVMYDAGAFDDNDIPREGAAIAAEAVFPASYGDLGGKKLVDTPFYFRTAVHEIGHAQNLDHNPFHQGFMQRTIKAVAPAPAAPGDRAFQTGIAWKFARDDAHRLRHMPDAWVRPGGLPYGKGLRPWPVPEADVVEEAEDLDLTVEPVRRRLPLGAPLRLDLELRAAKGSHEVPSLSFRSDSIRARVIDPSGTARPINPLVLEPVPLLQPLKPLKANSSKYGMTLVRGPDGWLMLSPGFYRVEIDLTWDTSDSGVRMWHVAAGCDVMVEAAGSPEHADMAFEVMSTPDVLTSMVLKQGSAAPASGAAGSSLEAASRHDVLGRHFAAIEARLLLEASPSTFQEWEDLVDRAADRIEKTTLMTRDERTKLGTRFEQSGVSSFHVRRALAILGD